MKALRQYDRLGKVSTLIDIVHADEEKMYGWKGENILFEKRFTLYPNLITEIVVNGSNFQAISNYVQITDRLLCAVVEQGAALTLFEKQRIYNFFSHSLAFSNIDYSHRYLFSPVLSTMNIDHQKDLIRLRKLQSYIRSACKAVADKSQYDQITNILLSNTDRDIDFAEYVAGRLAEGNTITFASYHKAWNNVCEIIKLTRNRPTVRDIA